jgi:hypothetical protein
LGLDLALTPLVSKLLVELFGVGNFVIVTGRASISNAVGVIWSVDVEFFLVKVLLSQNFEWYRRDSSVLVSILHSHICNQRRKILFEFSKVESDVIFIELRLIIVLHMLTDLS